MKSLNKKGNLNKSKHVLVENKLKLQIFDSSLFIGQTYFLNDGLQLYLIFQLLFYTLKTLKNSEKVISSKSKGLLTKKLTTPFTADNSLSATIKWHEDSTFCLIFKGSCLKQKTQLMLLIIE